MSSKIEEAARDFESIEKKIEEFSDMLSKIEHADAKKKILWREIYENAALDRQNAHILFVEAYTTMSQGTTEHATLGSTLTKYLERMNKSNDQLLKLAELISKSESEHAAINADDLFSQITKGE
tara:strand:- start:12269 stop:12640 length:372 start_codon:yes stop_codon:yes gene_type:complete